MKIAVLGSGISGLTAAYLLSKQHEVHLIEKNDSLGGHTATVDVDYEGRSWAVDTGFIVFNDRTYPLFKQLLTQFGVLWQDTEMSFSVTNKSSGLEYNGHSLSTLFAQKRNFFRPSFYRLLFDIVRFNKAAKLAVEQLDENEARTLEAFVSEVGVGKLFRGHYLYPMCAAIWSTSQAEAGDMPLSFFLRFFLNHGLLDIANRPQWHVIKGGSRNYIPAFIDPVQHVRTGVQVNKVRRTDDYVEIVTEEGTERFDQIILACHSDQALALLEDASEQEKNILGRIPYQPNEVVLHTDERLLPARRKAWASWNYNLEADDSSNPEPATVTYNMNILQGLNAPVTFCVTLNNTSAIEPEKILRTFTYDHPVYSVDSFKARQQRTEICGKKRTHFCGAYWYSGFHEDGVRSAFDVARRLGVE